VAGGAAPVPGDPVEELVSPGRAALLVIDVQNDLCHAEGAYGRLGVPLAAIQQAVERLLAVIEAARDAGVPVIFVKTHHDRWTDSPTWPVGAPRSCVTGTWGAEFYRLRPAVGDPVVVKRRQSGFYGTDLAVILRTLGRRTVLVSGVATNVCVESTARDAAMRDYDVVLVEDCAGAASREEHEATCWNVSRHIGHVVGSRRLLSLWAGSGG
jgi:ureidoacrylate peracid hydrolase